MRTRKQDPNDPRDPIATVDFISLSKFSKRSIPLWPAIQELQMTNHVGSLFLRFPTPKPHQNPIYSGGWLHFLLSNDPLLHICGSLVVKFFGNFESPSAESCPRRGFEMPWTKF